MNSIAFISGNGGVGNTSLVYHLAWMFADRGIKTLAVDLDPQANLTAMCLDDERLEALWSNEHHPGTVYGAIRPLLHGLGDIRAAHVERLSDNLGLIPGDPNLARFEDKLSDAWSHAHQPNETAFRTLTALHRLTEQAAESFGAELALIDVGPNLGAINRAVITNTELLCLPLRADLFSIQSLKNLGTILRAWNQSWLAIKSNAPQGLTIPAQSMSPIGYIIMQHEVIAHRSTPGNQGWMERIPRTYRDALLDDREQVAPLVADDPYNIAQLKHYRSLMPMAMEVRKPIFFLKSADGAIGAHAEAVKSCYDDFHAVAKKIAHHAGIALD